MFLILFFLLRELGLRLISLLLFNTSQSFRYRVLRFWHLLNFCLFRCENFADPIADVLHRFQILFHGGKLPGKFGAGFSQSIVFCLQRIQIDIQIHALLFEIAVRFVVTVQFIFVAFRIGFLSGFPADTQVLIPDGLMALTVSAGRESPY